MRDSNDILQPLHNRVDGDQISAEEVRQLEPHSDLDGEGLVHVEQDVAGDSTSKDEVATQGYGGVDGKQTCTGN